MATRSVKSQCFSCHKETITFICQGCSRDFCRNDLTKHLEELNKDLNKIENDYDQFKEKVSDHKNNIKQNLLMKEIDQWEEDSIRKIKQTADECKQNLFNFKNKFINEIENHLNKVSKEFQQIRQNKEFNEIDLNQFKQNLNQLKKELEKLTNISIKQQQSSTFINKIFISQSIDLDSKWNQQGITVAGGNEEGDQINQLYNPEGIFIDENQNIYIADWGNDRIVKWKSNSINGKIVAGGNGQENKINQLNFPRDMIINKENNSLIIADGGNKRVIQWSFQNNRKYEEIIISDIDCWGITMDKDGSLYVSDCEKNEVRRWKKGEKNGTIIAGGNGKGNNYNQFDHPTFIFIDEDYSLYVSDRWNHRIMKWIKDAKQGIIVAGGNGQGNNLTQLYEPRGVIVDQFGQVYVADCGNDRVMRWETGAKEGTIILGGNGKGTQSNQFNNPFGLSFDQRGNLYVADFENHRIQKFFIY